MNEGGPPCAGAEAVAAVFSRYFNGNPPAVDCERVDPEEPRGVGTAAGRRHGEPRHHRRRDVAAAVTLLVVVAALIEAVIYPASLLLYRLI